VGVSGMVGTMIDQVDRSGPIQNTKRRYGIIDGINQNNQKDESNRITRTCPSQSAVVRCARVMSLRYPGEDPYLPSSLHFLPTLMVILHTR
jgi:hypothetical protein